MRVHATVSYLKLVDFGFSKSIPTTTVDAMGRVHVEQRSYTFLGSPHYIAPEVCACGVSACSFQGKHSWVFRHTFERSQTIPFVGDWLVTGDSV